MPIIFIDTHTCEKCGRVFEWNYFDLKRQHINSRLCEVESIPHEKTLAYKFQQKDINSYDVGVNCPYCDFDNHFNFNAEQL